jgi:hypothetical protein
MHVVEALLKGRDVARTPVPIRVHMWFSEGLGEAVSGGTSGPVIRDLTHLNRLTEEYGRLSPVAFRTDADVGEPSDSQVTSAYVNYHYPIHQLAVEYLMDPDGLGKSPHDVVAIFTDIGDGMSFAGAFAHRTEMSLEEYEERFFDLMDGYLDERSPTSLSGKVPPIGVILAVGAGAILLSILTRGLGPRP